MRDAGRSFRALLVAVICGVPRYTVKCATRNDSAGGALWQDGLFSNALLEFTPSEPLDRCAKDLQAYRDDVSNLALWAVKMFDASSKGPVGLLSGDNYYLGHYDQCLSISVPDIRISGRYTIVKINFVPTKYPNYRPLGMIDYREPNPKSKVWVSTKPSSDPSKTRRDEFFWAICHPDSCSSDRLRLILEKRFNKIAGLNVSVNVDPTMSSTFGDEEPMTKGHYIFFTLIGLNLTLILIGTWHDLVVSKKCETKTRLLKNVLKPFSVSSNVRHLLKKNNDSELSIINGMKVIAVCNVILGRRILVLFGNALSNPEYNEKVTKTLWYGYFNPTVIMETFFVVSGFLTYHVVVKEINRTKTFDLMIMVIYRWLRIIPVYASVIAIYVFVLPRLGDGPLWKSIILKETKSCEISWWSNIAFLNNYISTAYLCVIPSWYLACDMHFFLLGSVLTYAAWKSIRVGVTLMAGALILSIYVPSKMIYDNKYWGSQPVYVEKLRDLNNEANYISLYIKSHNRATTYLIGLMMAVLYEKLKERKYKFSTSQLLFSMIVCIILGNAVFLSSYMLYIPGRPYDPWTNIILFSLTRIIWALTIGFIIIAHGTTGLDFFSAFLGHQIFNFLGKLTFCVYMYQEIVQLITVGTMRSPGYASNFQIIWMTCGDITATYVIAIVVHFMVESPCDRMQYKIIRFLTRGPKVNIKEDTKVDTKESTESYQPQPNNF